MQIEKETNSLGVRSVSINHIAMKDDKPVIVGTRITVHDIAAMHVMNDSSIAWIADNYEITPAQIHAALSYYYDHRETIDEEIRRGDALAEEIGISLAEIITRMQGRIEDEHIEEE